MTDRRRDAATAVVGGGGVAGGAVLSNVATQRAIARTPSQKKYKKGPFSVGAVNVARHGSGKGRLAYLTGAGITAASVAPLLVGTANLARPRRVAKRGKTTDFLLEGVRGATSVNEERAESLRQRKPAQVAGGALAVGALGALGGSQLGHKAVDRAARRPGLKTLSGSGSKARSALTALAGAAGAAATIPGTNAVLRRTNPDYKVTATGVKRRKQAPKRPSSSAKVYRQDMPGFRAGAVPSDPFRKALRVRLEDGAPLLRNKLTPRQLAEAERQAAGLKNSAGQPRWMVQHEVRDAGSQAVITRNKELGRPYKDYVERPRKNSERFSGFAGLGAGAGAVPVARRSLGISKAERSFRAEVGRRQAGIAAAGAIPIPFVSDLAAAGAAGAMARPENRRSAATRQLAYSNLGQLGGAAAGAYGGAALSRRYGTVERAGEATQRGVTAARARVPKGPAMARPSVPGVNRAKSLGQRASRSRLAAPLKTSSGKWRAAAVVGGVGGSILGGQGLSTLSTAQSVRRDRRGVSKAITPPAGLTQRDRQKQARKKRLAAAAGTATGLTGLGALGATLAKKPGLSTKLLATGAAIGGANSLNFAGVLRREADQESRLVRKALSYQQARPGALGLRPRRPTYRDSSLVRRRMPSGNVATFRRSAGIAKADYAPLKTNMKERDAKRLVRQHGLAGELPKTLTREQRMGAYEARYVASGGRRGEKWQRRANAADKTKNAGLGVATAGGAVWLGSRGKAYRSVSAIRSKPVRFHADNIAVAGATAGGGAELYASHARRKRASYASAPGGAAASALRRMRAMDEARS